MLNVHTEVPLVLGFAIDDGKPVATTGDLHHGVAPPQLVTGVIREGPTGAGSRFGARRRRRLTVVEHGAVEQERNPVEARDFVVDAQHDEQSVTYVVSDLATLRPESADEDRNVDRARRRVPSGVQHLHLGALPFDDFTSQQAAIGSDVALHEAPRDGAISHCTAAREARPEGDHDPIGCQRRERGGGGGVDHRMAQGRDEHTWPEGDAAGSHGGERERHPHVGALLRCVVDPGSLVAELLGDDDVVGRIESGRKRAGNLH